MVIHSTSALRHAFPSIAESKAMAEEGFTLGLPLVMNYAVMYEYSVDRNSAQFKARFNQMATGTLVVTDALASPGLVLTEKICCECDIVSQL